MSSDRGTSGYTVLTSIGDGKNRIPPINIGTPSLKSIATLKNAAALKNAEALKGTPITEKTTPMKNIACLKNDAPVNNVLLHLHTNLKRRPLPFKIDNMTAAEIRESLKQNKSHCSIMTRNVKVLNPYTFQCNVHISQGPVKPIPSSSSVSSHATNLAKQHLQTKRDIQKSLSKFDVGKKCRCVDVIGKSPRRQENVPNPNLLYEHIIGGKEVLRRSCVISLTPRVARSAEELIGKLCLSKSVSSIVSAKICCKTTSQPKYVPCLLEASEIQYMMNDIHRFRCSNVQTIGSCYSKEVYEAHSCCRQIPRHKCTPRVKREVIAEKIEEPPKPETPPPEVEEVEEVEEVVEEPVPPPKPPTPPPTPKPPIELPKEGVGHRFFPAHTLLDVQPETQRTGKPPPGRLIRKKKQQNTQFSSSFHHS